MFTANAALGPLVCAGDKAKSSARKIFTERSESQAQTRTSVSLVSQGGGLARSLCRVLHQNTGFLQADLQNH